MIKIQITGCKICFLTKGSEYRDGTKEEQCQIICSMLAKLETHVNSGSGERNGN